MRVKRASRRGRFFEQHGLRAHGEREEQVGTQGIAEEELGDGERDVVGTVTQHPFRVALGGVGVGPVSLDHGLRLARGSPGEEPDGGVVPVRGERVAAPRRGLEPAGGLGSVHPDHRPQVPRFPAGRHKGVGARTRHQGRGGPRVLVEIGDLLRRQLRVDHHYHGANLEDTEQRAHECRAVWERDDHPLLGGDLGLAQEMRETARQPVDLRVGHGSLIRTQRRPRPNTLGEAGSQEIVGDVEPLGRVEDHMKEGIWCPFEA